MPTILVCPLPLSTLVHEQLLAELNHELKTPLTGIMSLAQVLQRHTSPLVEREHQYADLIYQKSQQLLLAINDLFDLTQLCTHQFVLQLRPLALASIFNTALHTTQQITGLDVMQFTVIDRAVGDAEHWMMADQARLEQLFTHLICYLLRQDSPERQLSLSLQTHENWMVVTLSVDGLWLSDAEQKYLSCLNEPSGADPSGVKGCSSAMLKFLLARQLTQLHGGDISWTSDEKIGTTMTVLLPRDLTHTITNAQRTNSEQPLSHQPLQENQPQIVATEQTRPLTLLQLDATAGAEVPQAIVLELLTQLSTRYGCSILAVSNLDQAELLARIWKPKVMICPGAVPSWVRLLDRRSCLAHLPLFLFKTTGRDTMPTEGFLQPTLYPINFKLADSKTAADRLYQKLVKAASVTPEES